MRKTILSAACALSLVAFSPPTSGEAPATGEVRGAIHINGLGCGMMDADGGSVWVTSDRAVITPNGKERITCKAKGIPNSSRRGIQFNYENTGTRCWTDLGPTTEWHQTISASGNSTLTCFFR
jgi:hypothetical protein